MSVPVPARQIAVLGGGRQLRTSVEGTLERVVALVAVENLVAVLVPERVLALAAVKDVRTPCAAQEVVPAAPVDHIVTGDRAVLVPGGIPAVEVVVAGSTVDGVLAASAVDGGGQRDRLGNGDVVVPPARRDPERGDGRRPAVDPGWDGVPPASVGELVVDARLVLHPDDVVVEPNADVAGLASVFGLVGEVEKLSLVADVDGRSSGRIERRHGNDGAEAERGEYEQAPQRLPSRPGRQREYRGDRCHVYSFGRVSAMLGSGLQWP